MAADKTHTPGGPAPYVRPAFPRDAFRGAARDYVLHRPPYPGSLLRDMTERAGADGSGRLLDLACGPGRVTLPLAASFREAWAVDIEPEMLEAGRGEAARLAVSNVTWILGRAEELQAPPGSFDMVTIGDAFHRLDQPVVARLALRWLRPGGCLCLLGTDGFLDGRRPWQVAVAQAARRWRRPAAGPVPASGPEHSRLLLSEMGFADVASHSFTEPLDWTAEALLGYLRSTSVCSDHALGEGAGAFASEIRAALLACDPSGLYREDAGFGYTLGRRPA